jgi:hypothetical protein
MVDEKKSSRLEQARAGLDDVQDKKCSGYYDPGNYLKRTFLLTFIPLVLLLSLIPAGILEHFVSNLAAHYVGWFGMLAALASAYSLALKKTNKKFGEK